MTHTDLNQLAALRQPLQDGPPRLLENLAADLISTLVETQLAVSRTGFQHGGDAGTAGRGDRHLRVECKRYRDSTPQSDRELQGEVADALRRNPGLEAWILVSTQTVAETTRETLNLQADEVGVPIIVIDWSAPADGIPDLALLCAHSPHLVERHYGTDAARAARALAADSLPSLGKDAARSAALAHRLCVTEVRRGQTGAVDLE